MVGKTILTILMVMALATVCLAGGWDADKGHDVIRAHRLLEKGVKAIVTGWIYPVAHFI